MPGILTTLSLISTRDDSPEITASSEGSSSSFISMKGATEQAEAERIEGERGFGLDTTTVAGCSDVLGGSST